MNVLQISSDWKWTGPAEPMLLLMRGLRARGHTVELVCPKPPPAADRSLWEEACARGLEPIGELARGRSAWQAGDGEQVEALARLIGAHEAPSAYDVVHCWHTRDHLMAARALGRIVGAGARGGPAPASARIVRFLTHSKAPATWPWNRWLYSCACDGLLCVAEDVAAASRAVRRAGPLAATPGAVDLGSLESAANADRRAHAAARAALALPGDAFAIGVVARIQPHRRFDLLLDALARLRVRRPNVRLVVFGRGTRAAEVLDEPARARGLEEAVVRAGHRREDYAALLAAMDVFTYLVPGSDGTCRALREAAALGLPLVGTRRGAIGEIVLDGRTGLVVDESPEALAGAWERLAADPETRRTLGAAARADALGRFSPEAMAEFTERFYEAVVRSAPTSSR